MAETCWYNSKRMRLDDGCNNNLNSASVKESERWSCSGDTSLVEPEILEDMGVSMLADGEASRESLQILKTQECTISPKNFESNRHSKNKSTMYETKETFKSTSFEPANVDRVENENFIEAKNFGKEDSNDASDKPGTDPFYLFRRKKKLSIIGEDKFNKLSDEMILMILKWLPKKCLVRSMLVCKRWCQIARDEALWSRLDLGSKVLNEGTLGHILPRGVQILRLAQAEIAHPAFLKTNGDTLWENYICKLQYLDLSMAVVSPNDLSDLLSKCKYLKKLSLEKCTLNKSSCEAISNNQDLEVLNLTMCERMNIDCIKDLMKLTRLISLNIAWCVLDSESMGYLCQTLPSSITRLNIAGCRKTLTDDNLKDLAQCCPHLVELDLSDCTMLTINTVHSLINLGELEHLSLSRCYSIPTSMHLRIALMPRLRYLDIFGLISDELLKTFQAKCDSVEINKFQYSAVARPTVGVRRTSIWGLRVRD
ncbi:PREDICTED: S-phase kinase-associated protein 2 isoform X2 [Ceratosolen solmsi marchali]|uniref:S-phase kinase-associated protein 2 isoform X2 n=1 Tax=Ceratosolen solmsi marchali TaxID=326594 RepID=A0AAJ6VP49_9HYME|nr:PREDICTED: S-phase kinase-associated protein 2 isoform X2 [Ceratosolen solmsi marchali]